MLNAVGSGPDLAAARAAAYAVADSVEFRGAWYRRDIAEREPKRAPLPPDSRREGATKERTSDEGGGRGRRARGGERGKH